MEKQITFEMLIAGALVIFRKVDRLSMSILINRINSFYNINLKEETINNDNISNTLGEYELAGYTAEQKEQSRINLVHLQGPQITYFFENVDCHDLILQKVAELKSLHSEDVPKIFSKVEQILLEDLKNNGLVTYIWNYKFSPTIFQELVLTSLGRVRLFIIKNQKYIEEFITSLEKEGLNTSIVPEFLNAQNCDEPTDVYQILNLENFRIFCMIKGYNMFATLPEPPTKLIKLDFQKDKEN